MTNAVELTGSVSNLTVAPSLGTNVSAAQNHTQATAAPSANQAAAQSSSQTSQPTTSQAATTTTSAISPRITYDPVAGQIIQYLSDTGELESQIPSQTVVAYLKAGLTAQGLNKPQNQDV